ncbi:hypothetical protein HZS_4058 [Henneguya salminicola]|nr:hypothetical protein HZS_4058 [Henneguya salminicola]
MLYYIHRGSLCCALKSDASSGTRVNNFSVLSGKFCGLLSILSGMHSQYEITASEDSVVFPISSALFRKLSKSCPAIIPRLAYLFLSSLSPFLKNISFGLDWENFETGQNVHQQGSHDHNIYIILHGRLRLIREDNQGEKSVVGEFTRNDFVGIVIILIFTEVVVITISFLDFIQKYGSKVIKIKL